MSFGRAGHDDLARMAGHLSADTGDALGRRREIRSGRPDRPGELTWDLSLEAGQAATIRHRFTVQHPAQVTIVGL